MQTFGISHLVKKEKETYRDAIKKNYAAAASGLNEFIASWPSCMSFMINCFRMFLDCILDLFFRIVRSMFFNAG